MFLHTSNSSGEKQQHPSTDLILNSANLLFLEYDLVEKELQSFIGVVDTQLLKAVHL